MVSAVAVVLLFSVVGFAQETRVTNNSWWDQFENPMGLDEFDVVSLEALLNEIVLNSPGYDIRFMSVKDRSLAPGEPPLTFEALRGTILNRLGSEHVSANLTIVYIWSAQEQAFYISLPGQVEDRISKTVVNKILDEELYKPIARGQRAGEALFNTAGRLSRYIILAAETNPQNDQRNIPASVAHNLIDSHFSFDVRTEPNETNPGSERNLLVEDESLWEEPQRQNNYVTILVVIGIVVIVVVLLILRRRNSEYYDDEEYDDNDDESEDTSLARRDDDDEEFDEFIP